MSNRIDEGAIFKEKKKSICGVGGAKLSLLCKLNLIFILDI